MEKKLFFILLNVDVDNVDTSELRFALVEKTFESIDELTKFLVRDCKLRSDEFDLLTVQNLMKFFNDNSSIDNQWLTYTYINL